MLKDKKIIHLTPTPLVGAPGKIAWAQRQKGFDSTCFTFTDYPSKGPLSNKFVDHSILVEPSTQNIFELFLESAEIIHIHNFLPPKIMENVRNKNQKAALVYHAHSPMREGPLYYERGFQGGEYDLHLVVGQYAGRFYPDFIPVPNIVLDAPSVSLRNEGEKLRIMFSPTHKNGGRWNNKHNSELTHTLTYLDKTGRIELVSPSKPVHPNTLLQMRRSCHVSIDEIATGAFHQVSIEGMLCGNAVINRADFLSKSTFANFSDSEFPPFLYADGDTIDETLIRLVESVSTTREIQMLTHEYAIKHLDYKEQIKHYENAYKHIVFED